MVYGDIVYIIPEHDYNVSEQEDEDQRQNEHCEKGEFGASHSQLRFHSSIWVFVRQEAFNKQICAIKMKRWMEYIYNTL